MKKTTENQYDTHTVAGIAYLALHNNYSIHSNVLVISHIWHALFHAPQDTNHSCVHDYPVDVPTGTECKLVAINNLN